MLLNSTLRALGASAVIATIGFAARASADPSTLVVSSTFIPTASDPNQFIEPASTPGSGNDYSDDDAPGQVFTTGSVAAGYELNSITVQISSQAGSDYQADTYALGIYSATAGTSNYSLTYLGGGLYNFPDQSSSVDDNGDYITFDLSTPIELNPDATYAYTIDRYSIPSGDPQGYLGFAASPNNDDTAYLGGSAISNAGVRAGSPSGKTADPSDPSFEHTTTDSLSNGYDQNFEVELSDAPEPKTWPCLGLGVLGLLFLARRRLAA